MDWINCVIGAIAIGAAYSAGYFAGKSSKQFVPSQKSYLELEKFRWTHEQDSDTRDAKALQHINERLMEDLEKAAPCECCFWNNTESCKECYEHKNWKYEYSFKRENEEE